MESNHRRDAENAEKAQRISNEELSEETCLCCGSAKCTALGLLVSALFVKAKSRAMNLEQSFCRFPVLAFPAHSFPEHTRVQLSVARFSNSIQDTIGPSRQFLTQSLFEIRRDTAGQTEHIDKRHCGSSLLRTL